MAITSIDTDHDELTTTIVAEFPVPVTRLWQAYVDPQQIEKFGVHQRGRQHSPGTMYDPAAVPSIT
ncbi:MAG: hypothetical protein ACTH05_08755 [Yaniella sp.]